MRVAIVGTSPGSPFTNLRTSSRNLPFHSDQRAPGKRPTSYRPPASHGSAIIFVSERSSSSSMPQITGGNSIGSPGGARGGVEAPSEREEAAGGRVFPHI